MSKWYLGFVGLLIVASFSLFFYLQQASFWGRSLQTPEINVGEPGTKPWENIIIGFDRTLAPTGKNLITFISPQKVWVYNATEKLWEQYNTNLNQWINQSAYASPPAIGGKTPFTDTLIGFDRVYLATNNNHLLTFVTGQHYWVYNITDPSIDPAVKWRSGLLRTWLAHDNWKHPPVVGGESLWTTTGYGNAVIVAMDRSFNPVLGTSAPQLITLLTKDKYWIYDQGLNQWKNNGLIMNWFSNDAATNTAFQSGLPVGVPKPWENGILKGFTRQYDKSNNQLLVFTSADRYWVFNVTGRTWQNYGLIRDWFSDPAWKYTQTPAPTSAPTVEPTEVPGPTVVSTSYPTAEPTEAPEPTPTDNTSVPTAEPTEDPGPTPSSTSYPTAEPTEAPPTSSTASCPEDFDLNRKVDVADFLLFITAWGGTETQYDLNQNGRIDVPDLLKLLNAFGNTCPIS